ncbi:MAG: caspase family protein [Anaerolineae bacterium]
MTEETRAIGRRSDQALGKLQTKYRKHWGFVIGINDYGSTDYRPLKNAGNDAQEFANLLKFYNYNVHEIYDDQATKSGILGHLRDTLPSSDMEEDDAVIIFFAGHGASQEGKRGYIVPHGAGQSRADFISMGELGEVCDTLKARHILIILDCCFSGMAATRSSGSSINPIAEEHNEKFLNDMLSKPAWQIIMAGEADVEVADSGRNPKHSVFTYHLLQGLSGAADFQKDKIITARELEQYLYINVHSETKATSNVQIPFMKSIAPEGSSGDFIFHIPESIPHPWVEDIEPPPPPPETITDKIDNTKRSIKRSIQKIPPLYLGIGGTILVLLLAFFSYQLFRDRAPQAGPSNNGQTMTGEFNVAIAEFQIGGDPKSPAAIDQAAANAAQNMQTGLETLSQNVGTIDIWGPDQVGKVVGFTREQRAQAAQERAADIGADVVVYTFLDFSSTPATMLIEFAILDSSLTDAAEVAGEYQLGEPINLVGDGATSTRIDIVEKLNDRVDILSTLVLGLSYFKTADYDRALNFFEQIEAKPEWELIKGKELLYVLIGNAHGKLDNLDEAETAFNKAIELNPNYARGYLGRGNIQYFRAVLTGQTADDPPKADLSLIDQDLLQRSVQSYKVAVTVRDQPVLANIQSKSNFGLGQAYLLQSLSTDSSDFANAIEAFELVITGYGDGENSAIREIAAESHARLGLIYSQQGSTDLARQAYQNAADLLYDNPARQARYEQRVKELTSGQDA